MGRDNKYGIITVTRHSPIPNDEPTFLIRAKDAVAARAVTLYAESARAAGASPEFVQAAHKTAAEIAEWQRKHPDKVKVPD